MSIINIHTDGGARGNPGFAGAGYLIEKDNKEIFKGKKFLGVKTNNQAEYLALIESVEWLLNTIKNKSQIDKINFYLDSELVVRQVKGEYKVKNDTLKKLNKAVIEKLSLLKIPYFINSLPREKNKTADKLVNEAIDENT